MRITNDRKKRRTVNLGLIMMGNGYKILSSDTLRKNEGETETP